VEAYLRSAFVKQMVETVEFSVFTNNTYVASAQANISWPTGKHGYKQK
jgi:hypothetical protein